MAQLVEVEIELAGRGNGWTSITADTVSPMRISYGIRGAGPGDRTASAGTCTFSLNNSEHNSARTLGRYSPGGPAALAGFTLGARVRVSLYDAVTLGWYVRFIGGIVSLTPTPGRYRARLVHVVCCDWVDEAARSTVAGLTTQINKRSDEIVSLLIGNVHRAPESSSLSTGQSTFAYALDTARDDRANPILQEIARVTASELGFFYVRGNGQAVFESRFARISTTDAATFADTMAGLDVTLNRDHLLSKVQIVTHPRTVDTGTQTLYRLKDVTDIPAGGTITIVGGYTDPNNRASRVGGTSMISPVAGTDYVANSAANGSGTNLTASLTVSASFSGNGVRWTITNTAATIAYLTTLQARGIGIYDYETTIGEAEDTAVAADVGEQVCSIDMPYSSDVSQAVDMARYLLALYASNEIGVWALGTAGQSELGTTTQLAYRVYTTVGTMRLSPSSATMQSQIIRRDVGDRIALSETVTGVSSSYYIHAVDLEIMAPGLPFVTWTLAPADTTSYWQLNTAGFAELGQATRLAFT